MTSKDFNPLEVTNEQIYAGKSPERNCSGDFPVSGAVDQVCPTPRQAAIARRVWAHPPLCDDLDGRGVRVEDSPALVREEAVDPATVTVDLELP
ncbi:hypothetical protein HDC93_005259 [Streptomyces sp. AK010]|nr:hypothetical protein [Streptomyces sp. AK010]